MFLLHSFHIWTFLVCWWEFKNTKSIVRFGDLLHSKKIAPLLQYNLQSFAFWSRISGSTNHLTCFIRFSKIFLGEHGLSFQMDETCIFERLIYKNGLYRWSSISLEDVIRQFTFPSLKRLVYRPGTSRFSSQVPPVGARMDCLQSFLVRSQCPLIELEIHIPCKTTADLARVLVHLPSLECLTLSTDRRYRDNSALWLSDISFAEHLKFSVLSRLLPQLKVFRIEGKRAFSWDALIAFLKPPHRHVTSMRNTCVYIQFALYFPSQERSENYIDRDVVLRLKRRERKWKGAVSLDIKYRYSGEDWMQASLDHHEQASSILE